jgi:hypothetical protein
MHGNPFEAMEGVHFLYLFSHHHESLKTQGFRVFAKHAGGQEQGMS